MYFKESTHQYFILEEEYISFSALKKLIEPKKDWDAIAEAYAKKNKMSVIDVKSMWEKSKNDSCSRGTLLHLHKENKDKESNAVYFSEVKNDIKVIRDLETLEDGIHLEITLYNHEYKVCGTADKIFIETINGQRYVDIYDYKTSGKIDVVSYHNPKTKQYEMLSQPLSHLMNCNYIIYSLQLSTYAYFLEKYNIIPRKLSIIHVVLQECEPHEAIIEHDEKFYNIKEEIPYNVQYLKKEVVLLLKYYKKKDKKKEYVNENI